MRQIGHINHSLLWNSLREPAADLKSNDLPAPRSILTRVRSNVVCVEFVIPVRFAQVLSEHSTASRQTRRGPRSAKLFIRTEGSAAKVKRRLLLCLPFWH